MARAVADVSVVIPTIGRPHLLRDALQSLSRCEPRPAEVVVVDQSEGMVSAPVLDEVGLGVARVVACQPPGIARATNYGLANAAHPIVLRVDDDCTVRADWVAVASRAMEEDPDAMISGRVLPAGDPRLVPSTILLETPRDYTGDVDNAALYSGNMGCPRDAVLNMGGFDERIVPAASDGEFCYRWLRAGRRLRHVPELVVWHRAWRTPEELERQHIEYYQGLGMFYAKHLAARDMTMLRFLLRDCYQGLRSLYAARVRGVERWTDERRGAFKGLSRGLCDGWRQFGPWRRQDPSKGGVDLR